MRLAILLLLLAAPAWGATFTTGFTKTSPMQVYPCDGVQPITNGGITATFGAGITYTHSLALPTPSNTSPPECWPDHGEDHAGVLSTLEPGVFRNAPSGGWAASVNVDCESGTPQVAYRLIHFDPPIRFFSAWVTGVRYLNVWPCEPVICSADGGATWNTHCVAPSVSGSVAPGLQIELLSYPNPGHPPNITAVAEFEDADGWVGCDPEYPAQSSPQGTFTWHPYTHLCHWQYVEAVSPVPVSYVFVRTYGHPVTPFFMDDMTVATGECPAPPCEFGFRARVPAQSLPVGLDEERDFKPAGLLFRNTLTGKTGLTETSVRTSWGRVKAIYR